MLDSDVQIISGFDRPSIIVIDRCAVGETGARLGPETPKGGAPKKLKKKQPTKFFFELLGELERAGLDVFAD